MRTALFSRPNLIPVLSAGKCRVAVETDRAQEKARLEHATTALHLVGLGDRLHHLPRQLSGGQEQRVACGPLSRI
jgi:putative ABC transport system ATP-binding protein